METIMKPLLGISSCLLGNSVRYDGSHKRDRYIRLRSEVGGVAFQKFDNLI